MADEKQKILIVEDDLDVAEMLNAYFRVQGYEVYMVHWGEDGVRTCQTIKPDLVILDIRLPDIDGYEVARRLRTDRRTSNIPIIFLTEKRARSDRLRGLEIGADDYITKPFDVQELRLRVRNSLRRTQQQSITNPVTGMPEGPLVDERLEQCLQSDGWALMVVSLQNLDAFRDAYGFVASDDVLRAVSLMIHNALREVGSPDDFLGHLQATEFLLVVSPVNLPALQERITNRLQQALDYFYPLRDRERMANSPKRLGFQIRVLKQPPHTFENIADLKQALLTHS